MKIRGLSAALTVLVVGAVALTGCSADAPSPSARTSSSAVTVEPVAPTGSSTPPPAVVTTRPVAPVAATSASPPAPCATNDAAQLVRVSLRAQHLWMCAHHTLVRDTPITSGVVGRYTSTPTGTYTVQSLDRNTTLTLNTGRTYAVKYWIPFDGPLFGFHDASWQTFPFGSPKYRKAGSHGCVHMPLAAIAFLYRWAHVGATVRIRA